jgi:hypothetical protein
LILGVALILLALITWGIDRLSKKEPDIVDSPTIDPSLFPPADYTEDIFEDPKYLALIGNGVTLIYEESGISQALVEGKHDQLGEKVSFFADFISYMIHGDVSSYNNCFSSKYYEAHAPQPSFTMQKIYDVKLSYYTEESVSESDRSYTAATYRLEYFILDNNGTLRSDSIDGSKPLYFTITNRDGRWLIDSVGAVRYQ